MWYIVNIIQITLLIVIVVICASLGLISRLFISTKKANKFIGHYLFSPAVLSVCLIRWKVSGKENIPNYPAIYISNHTSLLDIPILFAAINQPLFYVAKMELKRVPFLGQYMQAMGMIFIDRSNREQAMLSMRSAIQDIAEGKSIVVFPEGTRSKTGQLQPFKRGAFVIACEGEIPIVPVIIHGGSRALKSGSFSLRPTKIEIEICPVVQATSFMQLNQDELAKEMHTLFLEKLERESNTQVEN
jgi:1-acyl-sn-glycerol-3-phosphate acyltransferase